jgi:chitin synthase
MPSHSQNTRSSKTIVDLSAVEDVNPKQVTDVLQSKFLIHNSYTDVGPCNIIAVNPFKPLAHNDAQTSEDYVTLYKSNYIKHPASNKMDPHIFQLTNKAFFHMRRTGNDQAIFLW